MSIEYRALGPLEVLVDGEAVRLGGAKQRTLLAVLLTSINRVVSTDRLVDEIWDDAGTGSTHTLRVHVSELRKLLEPEHDKGEPWRRLETIDDGYRLKATDEEFDVLKFEHLVANGQWHAALELWRGDAFAGLQSRLAIQAESTRLDEQRLAALEGRIEADLAAGHSAELISELQDLVVAHPYREALRRQLMLALYRAERQKDALDEYQRFAKVLGEELGIEPGPELRDLEERILLQDETLHPDLPRSAIGNLPAAVTSFVGREGDIATARRLLSDTRLLTLTGPGGVGKTRLSLELGSAAAESYPNGVWQVELASLRDPDLVPTTVAAVMGVDPQPDRDVEETLAERLAGKQLLILLDNCEHLLDKTARLAETLLQGCPGLTMIATSREPLGIGGETQYRVPPLETPSDDADASSESARLFIDRATARDLTFEVTPDNTRFLTAICTHLDGIPLAIELAAVRVGSLTLNQIAEGLENRFSLLTGGSRTSDTRQQTLEATLDWSHDLLTDEEQDLLRRLSVFRGSFGLDAVAALDASMAAGDATLDRISNLVSKSLVGTERVGGEMRYELLETVRQYARHKLRAAGEEPAAVEWHTAWYTGVIRSAEPHLTSRDQLEWLERLEKDHDNFRAALERSYSAGDLTAAVRLVGHLSWFWFLHSHYREGNLWLNRLIPLIDDVEPDLAARLLIGAGRLLRRDQESAAKAHLERAVDLAELAGKPSLSGWALVYISLIDAMEARFDRSQETAQKAQAIFQDLGQLGGVGFSMWVDAVARGMKARGSDQIDEEAYRASFEIITAMVGAAEAVGDRNFLGHVWYSLAVYSLDLGDDDAGDRLRKSIVPLWELGNKACTAHSIDQVARYAINQGNLEAATKILASTQAIRDNLGVDGHKTERFLWQEAKATLDASTSEAEQRAAWDSGYIMGFEDAVEHALEVLDL